MKYICIIDNILNFSEDNIIVDKKHIKPLELDNNVFIEYNYFRKSLIEKEKININNPLLLTKEISKNRLPYHIFLKKINISSYDKLFLKFNKLKKININTKYNNLVIKTDNKNNENNIILNIIYNLPNLLSINGNIYFECSISLDMNIFNLLILLFCMFDRVIISFGSRFFCLGYKNINISNTIIEKIFKNNFIFSLNFSEYDNILNKIYEYERIINQNKIERYIYTLTDNKEKLLKFLIKTGIETFLELQLNNELNKNELSIIYLNKFNKYFNTNKTKKYAELVNLSININIVNEYGLFLQNLILNNNLKKCCQIGYGIGITSMYILKNKNTSLTALTNKKVNKKMKNINLFNPLINNKKIKIIYNKNYLEELIKLNKSKSTFDFILISLTDNDTDTDNINKLLFYFYLSDLILNKGGFIIISNIINNKIYNSIKYIDYNITKYTKINSLDTIRCYKKMY